MKEIAMITNTDKTAAIKAVFDEREARFQQKWQELNENLENGTAGPIQKNGSWHIEVGTSLTPDEAFGPPSENEIEANKNKPLRQYLAELYPA